MPVTIDRFTDEVTSPGGYDPAFLSTIDLDPPTRTGLVVLPYTHFTVAIDPGWRLAASTAVNIDGSQLQEVKRGDDWRLDPRLPAAQQAGPELYASNDLDRGHLVRRRDPVWGTPTIAEQTNADTFHYTVCAPQTATLNQSKTMWLGLEDYVLDHARQYGERLSVFSGCIFADDDPVHRGVAIPRRFFKIAAWEQESELAATGYILDQTPSLGPIVERPPVPRPPLPHSARTEPSRYRSRASPQTPDCRWTNSSPRIGTCSSPLHGSNGNGGPNWLLHRHRSVATSLG